MIDEKLQRYIIICIGMFVIIDKIANEPHPLLLFCILIAIILVVNANKILNYLKDKRINKTVETTGSFYEDGPNPKRDDFTHKFLEAYKNNANVCFGLLFKGESPQKLYLAFSNEKHDELGADFEKMENPNRPQEIEHVYCQYTGKELYGKLPVKTWGPDLQLIDLTGPYEELTDDQKNAQTCTERKIIAKVLEDSIDTPDDHCLVLVSKYAPCKYCLSLIQEHNNNPSSKFYILVICNDFLKQLKETKKEISGKDIYDSVINHAGTILSAGKKANQGSNAQTLPKNTAKKETQEDKLLFAFAERQCKNLLAKNMDPNTIEKVLGCLTTQAGNSLPDERITKIINDCNQGRGQS